MAIRLSFWAIRPLDCKVTHVRTGDMPQNIPAMLAGTLADATNLGPKRMAGASKGISAHQIGWMRSFHARSETYRAAQACVEIANAEQGRVDRAREQDHR